MGCRTPHQAWPHPQQKTELPAEPTRLQVGETVMLMCMGWETRRWGLCLQQLLPTWGLLGPIC